MGCKFPFDISQRYSFRELEKLDCGMRTDASSIQFSNFIGDVLLAPYIHIHHIFSFGGFVYYRVNKTLSVSRLYSPNQLS